MKNNKANRSDLRQQNSLFNEVVVEKKKRSVKVCNSPKTYKQVPFDMTEEEEKEYIRSHYDEKGRFIFTPAPDFTILGGQKHRE